HAFHMPAQFRIVTANSIEIRGSLLGGTLVQGGEEDRFNHGQIRHGESPAAKLQEGTSERQCDKTGFNPSAGRNFSACRGWPFALQLGIEPSAGKGPIPLHGGKGYAKRLGHLRHGKPSKEAKFDHLRAHRIQGSESVQGFIKRQQVLARRLHYRTRFIECYPFLVAAMTNAPFSSGLLNEYPPHRLRSGSEEVAAAIPALLTAG